MTSPPLSHARRGRSLLTRMALALGLAVMGVGIFANNHAHAAFIACRSDPIVIVDGAIVDIVSTLNTSPANIRELDYTITVPTGSLLGGFTPTIGLGFPERVTYVFSPSMRWGTLQVAATVQTQAGVAPFATSVQLSSLLTWASASGRSDSTVFATLGRLVML